MIVFLLLASLVMNGQQDHVSAMREQSSLVGRKHAQVLPFRACVRVRGRRRQWRYVFVNFRCSALHTSLISDRAWLLTDIPMVSESSWASKYSRIKSFPLECRSFQHRELCSSVCLDRFHTFGITCMS